MSQAATASATAATGCYCPWTDAEHTPWDSVSQLLGGAFLYLYAQPCPATYATASQFCEGGGRMSHRGGGMSHKGGEGGHES